MIPKVLQKQIDYQKTLILKAQIKGDSERVVELTENLQGLREEAEKYEECQLRPACGRAEDSENGLTEKPTWCNISASNTGHGGQAKINPLERRPPNETQNYPKAL